MSTVKAQRGWREQREVSLSTESLKLLLANEIPAIRIKGFATPEECAGFATAMRSGSRKSYRVETPIEYIGISQYEFRWDRGKRDYFDAVPKAFADQKYVFDRSFDPMARLIKVFAQCWPTPLDLAQDEYGPYFAGIIRFASSGIGLHADFAPFNMPGYAIANIDAQIAWNLFVEAPASGGITTVHNAPWTPVIEPGVPPTSYGLPPESVAGSESFQYAPTVGDVVLFNSRNPHEVSPGHPADGRGRLQIGSFIGRLPDQSLALFT
jgi:hypothetical protein